jgi:type I restriction enzyme, S subunit
VNPRYMMWFFKSPAFRRFVDGLNTGSLIQHMFTSQLDSVAVPLPPLAEQARIAAEVEKRMTIANAVERALTSAIDRRVTLAGAVLRSAFNGELLQPPGTARA